MSAVYAGASAPSQGETNVLPLLQAHRLARGGFPHTDDGAAIRRRRQCTSCARRFTTVETTTISVIKRSGVTEPFDRSKIAAGVRKACQGRPVGEDDLAKLAQEVEELIRARGLAEINAHEVGLTILEPLSKLDAVAYLRFASVYQAFENLEDFEEAIARLREDRIAQ